MFSRRDFLRLVGGASTAAVAMAGYAFALEPGFRLRVARHRLTPEGWPEGLRLRVAALADLHASLPWMSVRRIEGIVRKTNLLEPDVTLLLGDYSAGAALRTGDVHSHEWAPALGGLTAAHGVFAVLGNHDWWSDFDAQRRLDGPTYGQRALEAAGIPVLENTSRRIDVDGRGVHIAGLGDQLAFLLVTNAPRRGRDDMAATMASISAPDEPVILMAHEPDIFPNVPDRVALTLAGHTHGGQVRVFGWSPVVPSRFGDRYAYGHISERGRDMIVSGGLGCSIAPVRFGVPPEIVVVDLG